MKNIIILLSIIFFSTVANCQVKEDTLHITKIMVKSNKYGPFHKMKIDYLILRNGEYVVVKCGKEMGHIHELPAKEVEEIETETVNK